MDLSEFKKAADFFIDCYGYIFLRISEGDAARRTAAAADHYEIEHAEEDRVVLFFVGKEIGKFPVANVEEVF